MIFIIEIKIELVMSWIFYFRTKLHLSEMTYVIQMFVIKIPIH